MRIGVLDKAKTEEIFSEGDTSPFCDVDSNLEAWLPVSFDQTEETDVQVQKLERPLNNQQVVELLGGKDNVLKNHLFSPQQIKYLVTKTDLLLKNGFSNLFFIQNHDTDQLYLVGVVYHKEKYKWTPYVYRLHNLYRSWSTGNNLFSVKG